MQSSCLYLFPFTENFYLKFYIYIYTSISTRFPFGGVKTRAYENG